MAHVSLRNNESLYALIGGKLLLVQHIYALHSIWQFNYNMENQKNLNISSFKAAQRSIIITKAAEQCSQCSGGLHSLLVQKDMRYKETLQS